MKKLLLLLSLLSSQAFGIVINDTQTAESTLSAITFAPPVQQVDVTIEVSTDDAINPGEAFKVEVYQGGNLIGNDTYQNTTTGVVTSVAGIGIEGTISTNPFSIIISAVTGSMDISKATVVAYNGTSGDVGVEYESINAALSPGGTQPPGTLTYGVVYTRAGRAYNSTVYEELTIPDQGYKDGAPDTRRIGANISASDIVYDSLDGDVRVLNMEPGSIGRLCSAGVSLDDTALGCAAVEARVSPDANQILYSVVTNFDRFAEYNATPGEDKKLKYDTRNPGTSCIYHYNLTTRVTTPWPCTIDVQDRQPTWVSNDKVVFASSRIGRGASNVPTNYPIDTATQTLTDSNASPIFSGLNALQLWTADKFGNDAAVLTPHEDNVVRPFVLPNGDILYSCFQNWEDLAYDAENKFNFPGSIGNNYWLCRINADGGDETSIFGGHFSKTYYTGGTDVKEQASQFRALRGIGYDPTDKWIYVNNYYTNTHLGLGSTYRFKIPYDDPHVEGEAGQVTRFNPSTTEVATPYGQDADLDPFVDQYLNKPMGVNGYYVSAPQGMALMTWGRGTCWVDMPIQDLGDADYLNGEPTCDIGIYLTDPSTFPQQTPFEVMTKIVDTPEYHEMDQDIVAPYNQKYPGYAMPAVQDNTEYLMTPGSNECYLNVVNARNSELEKAEYKWDTSQYGFKNIEAGKEACEIPMGCGTYAKDPADITSIGIYGLQWADTYQDRLDLKTTFGIREYYMGEQELKDDGSVRIKVPCDTPFKMAGLDSDGNQISKDQMAHSLRPGEDRFCWGCHDGHGEERAAELGVGAGNHAYLAFQGTEADLAPDPPILDATTPVVWPDIANIFETTCRSCHSDSYNDPMYGLNTPFGWRNIAHDPEQHFVWPQSKKVFGRNYSYPANRIRFAFAYTKGAGYEVGDALVFSSGTATGSVSAVDGSGGITKVEVAGGAYTPDTIPAASVDSQNGTGAELALTIFNHRLDRPYTSYFLHKFALQSKLYWKCVNERTDGNTDTTFPSDIDYGPVHESGATAEQCQTIARWIETGARYD